MAPVVYPINCFDLLDRIIASKTINLTKMENDQFSDSLDAATVYSGKRIRLLCYVQFTKERLI